MTIGNRVLVLLRENGLKQKDLAEYLHTKPSTVNGWKAENRNPSSDMIIPICEFLSVSPVFLLTGKQEEDPCSNNELAGVARKLSPTGQKELLDYANYLLYKESVAADPELKQAK